MKNFSGLFGQSEDVEDQYDFKQLVRPYATTELHRRKWWTSQQGNQNNNFKF